MGGHQLYDASKPYGGFKPPVTKHKWMVPIYMGAFWFYVFLRFKEDGGHHFLRHHSWDSPKVIEYLEKVDEKYGSTLSIDNMGHHETKGAFRVNHVPYPDEKHH